MELMKTNYKICCDFDFDVNLPSLSNLYLPIIGTDAFSLYQWLVNENYLQCELQKMKNNHESIFLSLGFNEDKFINARMKLEAMGLLITRLMENNDQINTHLYELIAPLKFEEFIDNFNFKNLLISRITMKEYERLCLAFKRKNEILKGNNISSTFEMIYRDDLTQLTYFQSEEVEKFLEEKLGKKISISQEILHIMETFFRIYHLGITEMQAKLIECYVFNNDKVFFLNPEEVRQKLSELVKATRKKVEPSVELYRNIKIFDDDLSPGEKSLVINGYLAMNCELYLACLQRNELTQEQRKLLHYLQQKQKLSDSVINLMLDYSIYKTGGHLNGNYLKKVAKTINLLNLKTVYDVLHYFQQIKLGIKNIDFYPVDKSQETIIGLK